MLDDSSGEMIEVVCVKQPHGVLPPPPNGDNNNHAPSSSSSSSSPDLTAIDLGSIVKVKGGIGVFRGTKQIILKRINIIRDTTEEIKCWNELSTFRTEVLDRPWSVDSAVERTLLRQARGEEEVVVVDDKRRKNRREKKKQTGRERKGEGREGNHNGVLDKSQRRRPDKIGANLPPSHPHRPRHRKDTPLDLPPLPPAITRDSARTKPIIPLLYPTQQSTAKTNKDNNHRAVSGSSDSTSTSSRYRTRQQYDALGIGT